MGTSLRIMIDRISQYKQYFLRGHGSWFALMFSLINFSLIFYNLLFKNLYFVPEIFKRYSVFLLLFGMIYLPVAIIVGYLDYQKGTFKEEAMLQRRINPVTLELFERLERIESKLGKIIKEENG